MEELFLGGVLAGEELDVIDQQRIDLLELLFELRHGLVGQGFHHRVEELLGAQVQHAHARVVGAHEIAGGVHQMGFAQAGASVKQQRVVGLARILGDLQGHGVAHLVAFADHEVVEGVMTVDIALEIGLDRLFGGCFGRRRRFRTGPDLDAYGQIRAGIVFGQLLDAGQVVFAHLIDHEGVRSQQLQLVAVPAGLQGLQPGMDIFRRIFLLQALQTLRPNVHAGLNLLWITHSVDQSSVLPRVLPSAM